VALERRAKEMAALDEAKKKFMQEKIAARRKLRSSTDPGAGTED
jgi:hypothetical protein